MACGLTGGFGWKWLDIILLICLAFAVPGTFVFSITETIYFDEAGCPTGAGNTIKAHARDWAAVEAIQINRARESSTFLFRNGLVRVCALADVSVDTACHAKSCSQANKKENVTIANNNIPLKLLI